MNKTEEIIKCAIEGNYEFLIDVDAQHLISIECDNRNCYRRYFTDKEHTLKDTLVTNLYELFCDPKFFQAIGKAKGYKRYYCVHCKKDFDKVGLITCDDCGKVGHKETMIHHAMEAYYINLTQSFDDAINYLYELIK